MDNIINIVNTLFISSMVMTNNILQEECYDLKDVRHLIAIYDLIIRIDIHEDYTDQSGIAIKNLEDKFFKDTCYFCGLKEDDIYVMGNHNCCTMCATDF